MNMIENRFSVLPVGQGFFYTGRLSSINYSSDKEFYNFVYDCGCVKGYDGISFLYL